MKTARKKEDSLVIIRIFTSCHEKITAWWKLKLRKCPIASISVAKCVAVKKGEQEGILQLLEEEACSFEGKFAFQIHLIHVLLHGCCAKVFPRKNLWKLKNNPSNLFSTQKMKVWIFNARWRILIFWSRESKSRSDLGLLIPPINTVIRHDCEWVGVRETPSPFATKIICNLPRICGLGELTPQD